jgi:hypothetical protein
MAFRCQVGGREHDAEIRNHAGTHRSQDAAERDRPGVNAGRLRGGSTPLALRGPR